MYKKLPVISGVTIENPKDVYKSFDFVSRFRISLYARIVPEALKQAIDNIHNRLPTDWSDWTDVAMYRFNNPQGKVVATVAL